MSNLCEIDITRIDDACVVRLRGEVDLSNAEALEEQVAGAGHDAPAVVIDLADVAYMDSSGFGMIERLAHRVALRVVVPQNAVVHRALTVTGLDQLVAVFPNVPTALAGGS